MPQTTKRNYLGNYPRSVEEKYLPYDELKQKKAGRIYPQNTLGPRAKMIQDLVADENDLWFLGYNESHEYPNGLYTNGSVEALYRSDLDRHARTLSPTVVANWYWYW